MQKIKRILSGVLVFCMVGACMACGQIQKGSLPDQAAVREFDANQTEIYIDDNAIALAEQIPSSENMDQAAQTAFALMNQQRAAAGLAALAWNQGLADAAKVRAGEIISLFAHKRRNSINRRTVSRRLGWLLRPTKPISWMQGSKPVESPSLKTAVSGTGHRNSAIEKSCREQEDKLQGSGCSPLVLFKEVLCYR